MGILADRAFERYEKALAASAKAAKQGKTKEAIELSEEADQHKARYEILIAEGK
jgi:hypothetical protein